jgi:hypothetical protein
VDDGSIPPNRDTHRGKAVHQPCGAFESMFTPTLRRRLIPGHGIGRPCARSWCGRGELGQRDRGAPDSEPCTNGGSRKARPSSLREGPTV